MSQFSDTRVLVVGDVMLDRYWFGEVDRISPEAPVPIVRIDHEDERLGGAANVARNISALGAEVSLMGVVGPDEAGKKIHSLLNQSRIKDHLFDDAKAKTTVKLRVLGRQQQLLRADFESAPDRSILMEKLDQFRAMLGKVSAVVLSDYGKGGLLHIQEMIRSAKEAGVLVLVDPKGDDYSRYQGADLLTPNRSEFMQVVGRVTDSKQMATKAHGLRRELGVAHLLITRSEEGMSLFTSENNADVEFHVPAQAREVFDVSGAGDTVIGTLAVMMACKKPIRSAVEIANRAGGIVVGKLGTAVVSAEELFG